MEQPETVKSPRKFDKSDLDYIADYVVEEHRKRKTARKDEEKQWKEIDRQLRMEPDLRHKRDKNGQEISSRAWMAEMELPLQSQTLEVLTADTRKMMFPGTGPWFIAHAAMEDEYLAKNESRSLLVGDTTELPSVITQDNIDKLVEGYLGNIHAQYDFPGVIDKINAESFKYGIGIGRMKMVSRNMFIHTATGVVKKNRKIPVLIPRSVWKTYLDNSSHSLMNEGFALGPGVITEWAQKHEDLILAANKGSNDPKSETGGWMPAQVRKVDPNKDGDVEVYEYEGDLMVPRKTVRSMFLPGVIVTVAAGGNAKVIRLRFRDEPFSSFIGFPYHHEGVDTPYCTSPLMKGRLIQLAATQALNRMMDVAALSAQPPIGFSKDDPAFTTEGPVVEPGALWESVDGVIPHQIGSLPDMLQVYSGLIQQYYDVTGVNPPRMGAQTVSHTTAFAKDAELNRGASRTVDYVASSLRGGMTRFLNMEYEMARKSVTEEIVYIKPYRGFVRVDKDALPNTVTFEVFGSSGPAEQREKMQAKMAAMQFAIQLDSLALQSGGKPALDLAEIQKQILTEGGWTDVDPFINDTTGGVPAGTPESPGVGGNSVQSPGIATAAIPPQ